MPLFLKTMKNFGHYCLKVLCLLLLCFQDVDYVMAQSQQQILLPKPVTAGDKSLEQLLQQRRSVREYQDKSISLQSIGQLLWAAQGTTSQRGYRSAPSAGALYPLELYVIAKNVDNLLAGVYHYQSREHQLIMTQQGDISHDLSAAALGQSAVEDAAAVIVIAAVYERTTKKYKKRGRLYVHFEAGHAAENLFLQVEALGLASVVIGAFYDEDVMDILEFPADIKPLLIMPIGYK